MVRMTIKEMLREERIWRQRKRELKRISRMINKRIKLRKKYEALGQDILQAMSEYHHKFY
jgi:hypothetical protein